MEDKEKIREEIARLKEETSIGLSEHENGVEQGRMEIINALSLFIDSLQEEPVSEELEDATNAYISNEINYSHSRSDTFKAGAMWQKENIWKDAQGNDLPEIDREVVALTQPYPNDERLRVVFAHRPNKYTKVWNSDLGEEQVVEIERHGKGGWNIPNVKWWLDCLLPNMEEG